MNPQPGTTEGASTPAAPTVSVVIPLYNKAAFVVEAVQSALAQRQPVLEVVVVDDGSSDGGADQVRALGQPQVRVVAQPNAGVSAARNRGIAMAQGDVVSFLDADDRLHPDYVATVVALARRFPGAGMLCTGYARVDAAGSRSVVRHPRIAAGECGLVTDFYNDWSRASFTCASAISVRRALLARMAEPFPVGERLGEDQDLWFRLAEATQVACCNHPLADYRVAVQHSATHSLPVLDMLPCYGRLAVRLANHQVPVALRAGARRLLACHLINLARLRATAGQWAAAAALLRDRRALANPLYWLRSVAWFSALRLKQAVQP